MTARQICERLGKSDMNYVRPRLTEMLQDGTVVANGTIFDTTTNRAVAVFQRPDERHKQIRLFL